MARGHYHVQAGDVGISLPESNDIYTNKHDAKRGATFTKDSWLDGWPNATVSGNQTDGYTIIKDPEMLYCVPIRVFIYDCTDDDCLLEDAVY